MANAPRAALPGVMAWLRARLGLGGDATLRESLEDVLDEHDRGSERLSEGERHMLLNIVGFRDCRVADVMVPRADIVAVEERTGLEALLLAFRRATHSRLPVYRGTLDDPQGMVHIKDVVAFLDAGDDSGDAAAFSLAAIRREVLFAPPSMPAAVLLLRMQTTRIHLALVIDEYGGTDGLVSIEDLVEEIVGEIEDEHDGHAASMLLRRDDGSIDASARAPVGDLEAMTGLDLLGDDQEEDIETLGGLVFSLVGRVPQRGEIVVHPAGLEIEVRSADPRRIKQLRVRRCSSV